MPRYYCDYCDTYLTHDSPSVRKQHNAGYKHKANVRSYYQQFEEQQTQSLIDQKIKEHLVGQTAFQQGVAFNQHLVSLPMGLPRPRLPILPPPGSAPMMQGFRPPILPRPMPGYAAMPNMQSVILPPGASLAPNVPNGGLAPRGPPFNPASSLHSGPPSNSNDAPPSMASGGYMGNAGVLTTSSGGYEGYSTSAPATNMPQLSGQSLPNHVYSGAPQPQAMPRVNPGGAASSASSQDNTFS